MKDDSPVFNAHPQYIDSMYQSWLADPKSVEHDWAAFFRGFDFAVSSANGNGHTNEMGPTAVGATLAVAQTPQLQKEFAVIGLIHGYRDRGHTLSTTNPLKPRKDRKPRLTWPITA